ncbi:hypothetical protein B4V02_01550 [Paenibacillus kribbensis]|uniref:Uncharacterized protein n=1 Tax=Paenibacillus kribbensis TaxID=172713 RepID=A0A222WHK8_9BACL|nr:hypothetical protein B4V02_01550 [Paenibacillus kribbensis]
MYEIRNQAQVAFPCWLQLYVDMNVQKRLKRKRTDGKQQQDGGRQKMSACICLSGEKMRTWEPHPGRMGVF